MSERRDVYHSSSFLHFIEIIMRNCFLIHVLFVLHGMTDNKMEMKRGLKEREKDSKGIKKILHSGIKVLNLKNFAISKSFYWHSFFTSHIYLHHFTLHIFLLLRRKYFFIPSSSLWK
jgi:hypothetical protein